MRLISQDGKIDLSYDKSALGISDRNNGQLFVITVYTENIKPYFIAEYSTEAKALKVMEMLREAYVGLPVIMQNVDVADEVIEKLKNQNVIWAKLPGEKSSIEYVNNAIFKFPSDEDVEV